MKDEKVIEIINHLSRYFCGEGNLPAGIADSILISAEKYLESLGYDMLLKLLEVYKFPKYLYHGNGSLSCTYLLIDHFNKYGVRKGYPKQFIETLSGYYTRDCMTDERFWVNVCSRSCFIESWT